MERPQRKKPERKWWIKVWVKEWLEGSIRFDLLPDERSVWLDLLVMAGDSRNPGHIQSDPTTGYPHHWLSSKLNIPLELLERTLHKCKKKERISENTTGITIINWERYQIRYEKQKVDDPDKYFKGKYGHMVQR